MPHIANQTSFKPGVVTNPNGAPVKELRTTTWIEKALDKVVPANLSKEDYEKAVTMREYIANKLVMQAATDIDSVRNNSDLPYIKEVLDRTEGKPKQSTELTGELKIVTPILSGLSMGEPGEDD